MHPTVRTEDEPGHPLAPFLLLLTGKEAGRRISLDNGRTTVLGRSLEADVTFPDEPSLSRLHLRIEPDGVNFRVVDLGSANGTRLNGAALTGGARLAHGDLIVCGRLEFRFEQAEPIPTKSVAARGRVTPGTVPMRDRARRRRATTPPDGRGPLREALARVPLFRRLSPEELTAVAAAMTERTYETDDIIVRQDDDGDALYIVLDGQAQVQRGVAGGESLALAVLGPGGFFGEMTLLDGQPRSATVRALARTRCALLPRWALEDLVRTSPAIAMQMLAVLSIRLRAVERLLTA